MIACLKIVSPRRTALKFQDTTFQPAFGSQARVHTRAWVLDLLVHQVLKASTRAKLPHIPFSPQLMHHNIRNENQLFRLATHRHHRIHTHRGTRHNNQASHLLNINNDLRAQHTASSPVLLKCNVVSPRNNIPQPSNRRLSSRPHSLHQDWLLIPRLPSIFKTNSPLLSQNSNPLYLRSYINNYRPQT